MRKIALTLLISVLVIAIYPEGVFAKTLNVKIRSIQRAGIEVAKSIAARIQATERYTVKDGDAELFIDMNCMEGKEVSGASGYICSFVFVYYPDKLANMEYVLGPIGLVTGPDVSSVAEDVFDTFVGSTTNEKLERAQKSLRIGVLSYCYNQSNKDVRSDCGQDVRK